MIGNYGGNREEDDRSQGEIAFSKQESVGCEASAGPVICSRPTRSLRIGSALRAVEWFASASPQARPYQRCRMSLGRSCSILPSWRRSGGHAASRAVGPWSPSRPCIRLPADRTCRAHLSRQVFPQHRCALNADPESSLTCGWQGVILSNTWQCLSLLAASVFRHDSGAWPPKARHADATRIGRHSKTRPQEPWMASGVFQRPTHRRRDPIGRMGMAGHGISLGIESETDCITTEGRDVYHCHFSWDIRHHSGRSPGPAKRGDFGA